MKFEIERLKKWDDGSANFTLYTDGGMFYEMKYLPQGFVVSAQQRSYEVKGETKYAKAFGAKKDTPAAKFFNEVAAQVKAMLMVDDNFNKAPQFDPDEDLPF